MANKFFFFAIIILCIVYATAQKSVSADSTKFSTEKTPEALVQFQLDAYNAHDVESFLSVYANDVEIYNFPNILTTKGKADMRKEYDFLNKTPKLFCKLLNRIVQSNMVIDHEEVHGFGDKPFYGIAIYIIENGKIAKVYFPK